MTEMNIPKENTPGQTAFAAAASSLLKIHEDWMDFNRDLLGEVSLARWLHEFGVMRVASGRRIGHSTWIESVISDDDYLVVLNSATRNTIYRRVKNVVYIPRLYMRSKYRIFESSKKRNRIFVDCCGRRATAYILEKIVAMLCADATIIVVG